MISVSEYIWFPDFITMNIILSTFNIGLDRDLYHLLCDSVQGYGIVIVNPLTV
jgi:hypothetical protein